MSRARFVTCPMCDGSGEPDADGAHHCETCGGNGEVEDDDADRQIDALDMIGLDPWGHEK